mmetsp:Transcript_12892/g.27206  ORF Transcript_12892/g.27206 Transcript_12892/m.27206 type:complete len:281 (+) Transcript_12892:226-1068(+)
MVRLIKASLLISLGHPQLASHLEASEAHGGGGAGPDGDHDGAKELDAELLPATTHEHSELEPIIMLPRLAVDIAGVNVIGEQADGDAAPHAAEKVNGGGVQGIVDPHLLQHGGGTVVDGRGESADEGSGPGLHDRAGRGDAHKTGKDTVEGGGDVGGVAHGDVNGEVDASAGGSGEGGGHGNALRDGHGTEGEGGDGVEAVPAEPQDEGAEGSQHGGVAGHVIALAGLGEATGAGAEEDGAHKRSATAGHVHDARASEVHETVGAHDGVIVRGLLTVRAV